MTALVMPEEACMICFEFSGTKIICDGCRKTGLKKNRSKWDRAYQERVCADALYFCRNCFINFANNTQYVCADHILTKGSRPDLRYDLSNGRCLCWKCHSLRHSLGIGPAARRK